MIRRAGRCGHNDCGVSREFRQLHGPAISHAKKIITVYLNGYDETENVGRTSHSYESVER